MKRRTFIKKTGLASSLALTTLGLANQTPRKRNILLYVVDDQGSTDAGCYGNPAIKTPGLDALAQEGVRFTNAFCTTASCTASRSVILTGLHNHANGLYGHMHDYHHFKAFDNIKSLPNRLNEAGYNTIRAGKYHVAPKSVFQFDHYIKLSTPVDMADQCKPHLDPTDKPFFLYFCTTEPHRPFKREGSDSIDPKDVIVPDYLPDTPECREELAQYYMSVQRADSGLLRLIQILKETGHWEDTLIIYISDNGIAFPGAKTTLYEPGMNLPCVVRNPFGQKEGMISHAMVSWADITPTILDFAGIPSDTPMHGRSYANILMDENPKGWDEVYASHTFHEITMYYPMRVVRERQYKLIWNIAYPLEYPFASDLYASKTWQGIIKSKSKIYGKRTVDAYLHRPEFEFYDLKNDPDEIHNLADHPDYQEELKRLKTKLKEFQTRTNDPWILKWEYE